MSSSLDVPVVVASEGYCRQLSEHVPGPDPHPASAALYQLHGRHIGVARVRYPDPISLSHQVSRSRVGSLPV